MTEDTGDRVLYEAELEGDCPPTCARCRHRAALGPFGAEVECLVVAPGVSARLKRDEGQTCGPSALLFEACADMPEDYGEALVGSLVDSWVAYFRKTYANKR